MEETERGDLRQIDEGVAARPVDAFRLSDWWDYKLTPPLAIFWATAMQAGQALLPLWQQAIALVAAISVCAAYVSLINDYFDRDEDARSGKPNRLSPISRRATATLFALVGAAGLFFFWIWRHDAAIAAAYLGSWIAFTAYSAPPVRLKTRGLAGVIADASGASLLPCVLAVLLATQVMGHAPDPAWLAAVSAWAFGWGLRGIAWHQLADLEQDRAGKVHTFAMRHGAEAVICLSRRFALPLELAGLAALLWQIGSLLPLLFLLLYFGLLIARSRLWATRMNRLFLLDEFQDAFLPLAILLGSATLHPADLILLVPLLALFGRRPARVARETWQLALMSWYWLRGLAGAFRRAISARG